MINFYTEKADVFGNHLDFSLEEKSIKPDDTIEVKNYDGDVLDKFMLTCIKALQNKINELEKQIKKEETN